MDFMRNFFFQIVSYYNISLDQPASIFPNRESQFVEGENEANIQRAERNEAKYGKRATVLLDLAIPEFHF